MTTFNQETNKAHSNQIITKARQMSWVFIAFVFALMIYPSRAHAQVIGTLDVNIPFQFQAGESVLPPGNYIIRMMDNTELAIMQITSKDNPSTSALFRVHEKDLTSAPTQNEVLFNKYGDHYFLAQVFDEGDPSGSEVVESNYEQKVSKAATETKVHVATQQHQQQGD
jgi:hypothetical protein